jgi:hypothetical protein
MRATEAGNDRQNIAREICRAASLNGLCASVVYLQTRDALVQVTTNCANVTATIHHLSQ